MNVNKKPPADVVGRASEWKLLRQFVSSAVPSSSLGIVWGRRRIGKSFLLATLAEQAAGFYFEATRGASAETLEELGVAIGRFQGAAGPIAIPDWRSAIETLLRLAATSAVPVVLDEFPYLLEHTPELDSYIQRAFAPRGAIRRQTRARLILCGSAMAVMSRLLAGEAALRGRASLDLRMAPFDFREARRLHDVSDLPTAVRTFAVIGGVAAYARDMVDSDLPRSRRDFDRWVVQRVLSPAAPLLGEVELLLSEDPTISSARKLNIYHAILAGVAAGNSSHQRLTRYLNMAGPQMAPFVETLVATQFLEKLDDPTRERRPLYLPADSLIRFHYAVIRPRHQQLVRARGRLTELWKSATPTFDSQVLGPCFEAMARRWTQHHAGADTLGTDGSLNVGSVTSSTREGELQLDVVATTDTDQVPMDRTVSVIGEAKVSAELGRAHLDKLERARAALGERARDARLLFFGSRFSPFLRDAARTRHDVDLVDLERLYDGD